MKNHLTKRQQVIFCGFAMLLLWLVGVEMSPIYGAPMAGLVTGVPERAAMIQRDMSDAVMEFRPSHARTLSTFEQGTRKKTARLAGLQIPYWKDRANGQTLYSPVAGSTSFKKSTKQNSGAMYAGVVFRNMNIWLEAHVLKDMERGFIPDSYIKERRRRISTHMWKKNIAAIGDGTGMLAKVASDASGSTVTVLADNSARGTSKGVYRLQESTSADPLYYDCIETTGGTVQATFYISAKLSATTFTASGFTVGAITDIDTGDLIVESGTYNKEIQGIAAHISDSTSRIYQGADVSVDTFLQNMSVDAGAVAVTPSAIHSAKGIMMTRCNQEEGKLSFIGHISWGNYRNLAKFGYTLRQADSKEMKTVGLPNVYEDGDTMWVPDADYEDAYIDLRERACFFEYVQKEFGLKTVNGQGRHEWIGSNDVGSTNEYENYNEACNIVWDSRGKDGSGDEGGNPNTSVFIKNIALPTERQSTYGV